MAIQQEPVETKREKIIAELMRRLDTIVDPRTGKGTLVERGYAGVDIMQLPKIVVFEDTEVIIEDRRGLYAKTLPTQIEYFRSISKPEEVYIQGNRMLAELTRAVEMDERFFPDAQPTACPSLSRQGPGLVRQYRQTRNELVELSDNRVLTIAWYEFIYWDCRPGVVVPPSCR